MEKGSFTSAEIRSTSVRNQFELLNLIIGGTASVSQEIIDLLKTALVSQGALAALELPERGIIAMSLNTHKAIANKELPGRYESLNDYRKTALEKLKIAERRATEPRRGTQDWYKSEIESKTLKLKQVTDDIAHMSQQLGEVLLLAQKMAQKADQENEFNELRAELLRKFKRHEPT